MKRSTKVQIALLPSLPFYERKQSFVFRNADFPFTENLPFIIFVCLFSCFSIFFIMSTAAPLSVRPLWPSSSQTS